MKKLKEVKEECLEEVYQCERMMQLLTRDSLPEILPVCKSSLHKLEKMAAFLADDEYSMYVQVFDINLQALSLLLEYSDVFHLNDYDYAGYKDHCLGLLKNLRILLGDKGYERGDFLKTDMGLFRYL